MSSVKYLQYRYMFRTCNTAGGGRHAAAPNNAHELFQTQTFSPAPDKEGTAPGAVGVRSNRVQILTEMPSPNIMFGEGFAVCFFIEFMRVLSVAITPQARC